MTYPFIEPYWRDYVKLYLIPDEPPAVIPVCVLTELYEAIYQYRQGGELNSHGWNGMIVQDMQILGKFGCSAPSLFNHAERLYKKTGKTTEVWQCIKVYGADETLMADDEEPEECPEEKPKQTGLEAFL